jgi:FKBP-type peptidyl-prolyl cis-trans isomerase
MGQTWDMPVTVANPSETSRAPQISVTPDTLPSSLEIEDLVIGEGREANTSHTVEVHYAGVHVTNGQEFDSSWNRGGRPTSFPLNGVIAGFRDGIAGMKEGGRRILVVPPDMGYGSRGAPPAIGPNETLVFVVDLVRVS